MATLTCERAAVVLRGLEKNELAVETEEIEELLTLGLAVEADPDDLAMGRWLQPTVREFAGFDVTAALLRGYPVPWIATAGGPVPVPSAPMRLEARIREIDEQLKNDWYRMTTGKMERMRREDERITMRRALGLLRDRALVERLAKILDNTPLLAPNAQYVTCQALGSELYALTRKGYRIRRSLKIRLERFGQASLKSFIATFDKTETKMRTFSGEVTTLSHNIGFVKKNKVQAVIGLTKMGVPSGHALGAYHQALRETRAPDVAVTCARNAASFGGPTYAAARLRYAEQALQRAGYPNTPIAMGAAKSLLAFDPPDKGIPRFMDFMRRLEQVFGRQELLYKLTVRLMPATGEPAEVVARVIQAGTLLNQHPSRATTNRDNRMTGVALASMVKSSEALPELVVRFRDIEERLARSGLSSASVVEGDALESVGCPGTPDEVVDTVAVLAEQISERRRLVGLPWGRPVERPDVTIAVAFAKRFAF